MDEQELLTAKDAAAYLGVSRARIHAIRAEGRIGRQIGGIWFFTKPELDQYLDSRRRLPTSPKYEAGALTAAHPA